MNVIEIEEKRIILELSQNESIIFFEAIARINEGFLPLDVSKKLFFDLECALESKLSVLLDPDYHLILERAKKAILTESE